MYRPIRSDDFYRRAEERRKALAAGRPADQRVRKQDRSAVRCHLPPRAPAGYDSAGIVLATVLGAVVLLACAASATAVVLGHNWLQGTLNSPTAAAQDFCSAMQRSDYAAAYRYFSSSARAHLSESAFADQFGSYDAIDGAVTQVSIGTPQYRAGGNVALVSVRALRSRGDSRLQVDQLMLVKEQGAWRIDSISIQFGVAATPTARD